MLNLTTQLWLTTKGGRVSMGKLRGIPSVVVEMANKTGVHPRRLHEAWEKFIAARKAAGVDRIIYPMLRLEIIAGQESLKIGNRFELGDLWDFSYEGEDL